MKRYFDAWSAELATFLPAAWRTADVPAYAVVWRQAGAEFFQESPDGTRLSLGVDRAGLARVPAPVRLVLRMGDENAYRCVFTLPPSPRRLRAKILENEIPRQTPWRLEQVYCHADMVEVGPSLRVTLTVLPRKPVMAALESLAALGVRPTRLALAAEPAVLQISLATGRTAGPDDRRGRPWLMAVASLALAGSVTLAVQAVERSRLDRHLAAVRAQAQAVQQLALAESAAMRRIYYPTLQKAEVASPLVVLAVLSRTLPADSWVEELKIDGKALTMTGYSADAAPLLGLLETSGHFTDAHFLSALARRQSGDTADRAEKFQLAARIVPHAAP